MTPFAQARQALKAALNGRGYGYSGSIQAVSMAGGGVYLSREAARLIDAMLTRAHYEGELEKAERDNG